MRTGKQDASRWECSGISQSARERRANDSAARPVYGASWMAASRARAPRASQETGAARRHPGGRLAPGARGDTSSAASIRHSDVLGHRKAPSMMPRWMDSGQPCDTNGSSAGSTDRPSGWPGERVAWVPAAVRRWTGCAPNKRSCRGRPGTSWRRWTGCTHTSACDRRRESFHLMKRAVVCADKPHYVNSTAA